MIDLSDIRERPDSCWHVVRRNGDQYPCDKPAVAVRLDFTDSEKGDPYPVCKHHTAGDCLPLTALFGDDVDMLNELKRLRRMHGYVERLRAERNKFAEQIFRAAPLVREMASMTGGAAAQHYASVILRALGQDGAECSCFACMKAAALDGDQ